MITLARRSLAGGLGLALFLFSPLFFARPLEDAYLLPQRAAGLLGLGLAFLCMEDGLLPQGWAWLAGLGWFAWRLFTAALPSGAALPFSWMAGQALPLGAFLLGAFLSVRGQERPALVLGAASLALTAAYSLFQLWGMDTRAAGAVDFGFLSRAHGSLGNPDFLAGFLVLGLPGLLALWAAPPEGQPARRGWLAAGVALLLSVALVLTQVRATWLAAALGCSVALWAGRGRLLGGALAIALGVAVVVPVLYTMPGPHNPTGVSTLSRASEAFDLGDAAWTGRAFLHRAGWRIVKEDPVFGCGPGRLSEAFLQAQGRLLAEPGAKGPYRYTHDLHDDWLQAAAESGLPGLALLLCLFALALAAAFRRKDAFGAAVAGGLVAFAVHGAFHFPLGVPPSAAGVFLLLGLAAGWSREGAPAPRRLGVWMALPCLLAAGVLLVQFPSSALLNSGTSARLANRPDLSALLLAKAASLAPDDSRAWSRLGLAQDALGKDEGATAAFLAATEAEPSLYEAWSNLALSLGKQASYEPAAEASRHALALNPISSEAWSNLGKVLWLNGDATGALQALEEGVKRAPSALLWFNLGALRYNRKDRQGARTAFIECLKLDHKNGEALRLLAELSRGKR